jgi:hypothetical protein
VIEHEQADRRGKVSILPPRVDVTNQFRDCELLAMRDVLQVAPEQIFQADTGLVSRNNDRAFDDDGLHLRLLKACQIEPAVNTDSMPERNLRPFVFRDCSKVLTSGGAKKRAVWDSAACELQGVEAVSDKPWSKQDDAGLKRMLRELQQGSRMSGLSDQSAKRFGAWSKQEP